jgi:peroxiredoxin
MASELVEVWEARTDADGRYRIEEVRGMEGDDYQHLATDVNAPDFVEFADFFFEYLNRVAKAKGALADVRLARGDAVMGRCIGPDGKTVAGAKIHAAFADKPMSSLGRRRTTDAEGRFRLAIPHGRASELIVYPEQWAPRRVSIAAGGGDLGDVRLEAGVELSGQLVMPTASVSSEQMKDFSVHKRIPGGWALGGKVIALESTDRGQFGWFPITLACKTDRDGRFRIPALKGSFKILAAEGHDSGPDDRGPIVSDGPPPAVLPQVVDFNTGSGGVAGRLFGPPSRKELTLFCNRPVTIRGTITGTDGKPAQGVSLHLSVAIGSLLGNPLTPLQWTTTDAKGHYTFTGIPRGLTQAYLQVYAEPPDHRSYIAFVASGNFQGRAHSAGVSFQPLDRDQDPLDWRLKFETPEPPKVLNTEDKELIKLGEEVERLEKEFSAELAQAKTSAARAALVRQKLPSNVLASRFLDLATAHPNHPVAISALGYVFQRAAGAGDPDRPISKAREQAIDQVIERHLENPDIVLFFPLLQHGASSPKGETLLRAALARSPHREVQAAACYELARFLRFMADAPETLKTYREKPVPDDPESRRVRESYLGNLERFAGVDSAKARAEAEQLLERVKRDFADVPQARFMVEGPGLIQFSRYNSAPKADIKTYGTLSEQALFELRELTVGRPAPDIEGEDADGHRFKLSDYRGKVAVLTFSGNWCGPCRAMYPQERELVARLKNRPFALLSVNTDPERETLRKSIRDGEITWRCWWDGGQAGPISSRWNILSFPAIFVIDAKGVIREIGTRGKDLDQTVERLVEETHAIGSRR